MGAVFVLRMLKRFAFVEGEPISTHWGVAPRDALESL
jgi:hypothetical protein